MSGLEVQNGGRVFAMRHGNRTARLGRPADQRKALIRSLVTEVLRHGKITTTKTRAKAIRKWVPQQEQQRGLERAWAARQLQLVQREGWRGALPGPGLLLRSPA